MISSLYTALATPIGSAFYHILIAIWLLTAFSPALSVYLRTKSKQSYRIVLGSGLLLGIRAALFITAGLDAQGFSGLEVLLPIIDHTVNTLSILIIIWLWAAPQPDRRLDQLTAILGVILAVGGAASILLWNSIGVVGEFNNSDPAFYWNFLTIVLLFFGEVIIYQLRPNGYNRGLVMLSIILIGYGAFAIEMNKGDDIPGAIRLAHLLAFPILLTLPWRLRSQTPVAEVASAPSQTASNSGPSFMEQTVSPSDLAETAISPSELENEEDSGEDEDEDDQAELEAALALAAAAVGESILMDEEEGGEESGQQETEANADELDNLEDEVEDLEEDEPELDYDLPPDKTGPQRIKERAHPRKISLKLFQNTLTLAASKDQQTVFDIMTYYISNALVADMCLLTTPPSNSGQIIILSGYNLIIEENMAGASFDQRHVPGLMDALRRGRPLQMDSVNLGRLADALFLDTVGNFMCLPILSETKEVLGLLILISPYSKYVWTADELSYLRSSHDLIREIVLNTQIGGDTGPNISEDLIDQLQQVESQKQSLELENEQLLSQIDALNAQAAIQDSDLFVTDDDLKAAYAEAQQTIESLEDERKVLQENLAMALANVSLSDGDDDDEEDEELTSLRLSLESAQQALIELNSENEALKANLQDTLEVTPPAGSPAVEGDGADVSGELTAALAQVAALQAELESSQSALRSANGADGDAVDGESLSEEQVEVIASIAQELRQPMSSISGYTDLLLSESVGILGALQRKFLDRVKASTDRMNSLIEDILQITVLDSGQIKINPEMIELNEVLDEVIGSASAQLREKDIVLRVDLPNKLPKMTSDKDSIQQVLNHLLQNAGAATPQAGEVFFGAQVTQQDNENFILIEVTDTGEGIPEDDINRVFSRVYRADNPLIQGVGDRGVGLSIAKTLTEALGGRIWVESEIGSGATFSVLLPCQVAGIPEEN